MSPARCAACGHGFERAAAAACGSCPLRRGCPLVCCPACGHVDVDVARSRVARLVTPLLHGRAARRPRRAGERTLADVPPERCAVVRGFRPGIPADRQEQFRAYGLAAGRAVKVLQQAPVTIVRVDHTELAFERDLARWVLVDA